MPSLDQRLFGIVYEHYHKERTRSMTFAFSRYAVLYAVLPYFNASMQASKTTPNDRQYRSAMPTRSPNNNAPRGLPCCHVCPNALALSRFHTQCSTNLWKYRAINITHAFLLVLRKPLAARGSTLVLCGFCWKSLRCNITTPFRVLAIFVDPSIERQQIDCVLFAPVPIIKLPDTRDNCDGKSTVVILRLAPCVSILSSAQGCFFVRGVEHTQKHKSDRLLLSPQTSWLWTSKHQIRLCSLPLE